MFVDHLTSTSTTLLVNRGMLVVEGRKAARSSQGEDKKRQAEGLQAEGLQAEGLQAEGLQAEGLQAEGLQAEGLQAEGLQAEGLQAEGLQAEGLQAEGLQAACGGYVRGRHARDRKGKPAGARRPPTWVGTAPLGGQAVRILLEVIWMWAESCQSRVRP